MPVAEVGKIYEYKGKKYVACKAREAHCCDGCALYEEQQKLKTICPKMMSDGIPYTCIDEIDRDDVIFVEVEDVKEN